MKYKKGTPIDLTCQECGNTFQAIRIDAMFCGPLCNKRHWRGIKKYEIAEKLAEKRRLKKFALTQSPLYAPK